MKKQRPVIKIHGGKFYLCDWIISMFPNNYTELNYVEPFGGAGSVLLNKVESKREIYNDINYELSNIFSQAQQQSKKLCEFVSSLYYDESTFAFFVNMKTTDLFMLAIKSIVSARMSRGGLGKTFSKSARLRGGIMGDANAWKTFQENVLPKFCELIKDVKIRNDDALCLIKEYTNDINSLIYCDPPYLPETRTATKVYKYELSIDQHKQFLNIIKDSKAKIILSGYDNVLYNMSLKDWNTSVKYITNHSSQSENKNTRTEKIWKNY